jgi:DNA-binding PadR family transcriptional regulator
LDLFARRKGKQRLETLLTVLRRLQREGWLRVEPQSREREESEIVYSLTTLGQQRVEAERVRQGTLLSQFIEEGDFDKSFQTFLDRGGSHAGN